MKRLILMMLVILMAAMSFCGCQPDAEEHAETVDETTAETLEETEPPEEMGALTAKPVIYLYPEKVTDVTVNLNFKGELTTTYPKYENGWQVTAHPDGTIFIGEQSYSYLYWEGISDAAYDFSEGFVVRGEETAAFLEDALAKLGLNRREANEFIVYWLPRMEENAYNLISFQDEIYTSDAELSITPAPDSLLRVFMAWMPLDEAIEIPEQELAPFERDGFVVVEWGGAELG